MTFEPITCKGGDHGDFEHSSLWFRVGVSDPDRPQQPEDVFYYCEGAIQRDLQLGFRVSNR